MYKKIIVLFLLLGTSLFVLPAESRAADKTPTTIAETASFGSSAAMSMQRYRRRWRSARYNRYNRYRWNYRRNNYRRNNYRRSYRRVYYTPYYRRNYRRYRIY